MPNEPAILPAVIAAASKWSVQPSGRLLLFAGGRRRSTRTQVSNHGFHTYRRTPLGSRELVIYCYNKNNMRHDTPRRGRIVTKAHQRHCQLNLGQPSLQQFSD